MDIRSSVENDRRISETVNQQFDFFEEALNNDYDVQISNVHSHNETNNIEDADYTGQEYNQNYANNGTNLEESYESGGINIDQDYHAPEEEDYFPAVGDENWVEYYDEESGYPYLYNVVTGESRWIDPEQSNLKVNLWEKFYDDSGNEYYYNKETGESTWDMPIEYTNEAYETGENNLQYNYTTGEENQCESSCEEGGVSGSRKIKGFGSMYGSTSDLRQGSMISVKSAKSLKSLTNAPVHSMKRLPSLERMRNTKRSFDGGAPTEQNSSFSLAGKKELSWVVSTTPSVDDTLKPKSPNNKAKKGKKGFALLKQTASVINTVTDEDGTVWLEYQMGEAGPLFYAKEGSDGGTWKRPAIFDTVVSAGEEESVEIVDGSNINEQLHVENSPVKNSSEKKGSSKEETLIAAQPAGEGDVLKHLASASNIPDYSELALGADTTDSAEGATKELKTEAEAKVETPVEPAPVEPVNPPPRRSLFGNFIENTQRENSFADAKKPDLTKQRTTNTLPGVEETTVVEAKEDKKDKEEKDGLNVIQPPVIATQNETESEPIEKDDGPALSSQEVFSSELDLTLMTSAKSPATSNLVWQDSDMTGFTAMVGDVLDQLTPGRPSSASPQRSTLSPSKYKSQVPTTLAIEEEPIEISTHSVAEEETTKKVLGLQTSNGIENEQKLFVSAEIIDDKKEELVLLEQDEKKRKEQEEKELREWELKKQKLDEEYTKEQEEREKKRWEDSLKAKLKEEEEEMKVLKKREEEEEKIRKQQEYATEIEEKRRKKEQETIELKKKEAWLAEQRKKEEEAKEREAREQKIKEQQKREAELLELKKLQEKQKREQEIREQLKREQDTRDQQKKEMELFEQKRRDAEMKLQQEREEEFRLQQLKLKELREQQQREQALRKVKMKEIRRQEELQLQQEQEQKELELRQKQQVLLQQQKIELLKEHEMKLHEIKERQQREKEVEEEKRREQAKKEAEVRMQLQREHDLRQQQLFELQLEEQRLQNLLEDQQTELEASMLKEDPPDSTETRNTVTFSLTQLEAAGYDLLVKGADMDGAVSPEMGTSPVGTARTPNHSLMEPSAEVKAKYTEPKTTSDENSEKDLAIALQSYLSLRQIVFDDRSEEESKELLSRLQKMSDLTRSHPGLSAGTIHMDIKELSAGECRRITNQCRHIAERTCSLLEQLEISSIEHEMNQLHLLENAVLQRTQVYFHRNENYIYNRSRGEWELDVFNSTRDLNCVVFEREIGPWLLYKRPVSVSSSNNHFVYINKQGSNVFVQNGEPFHLRQKRVRAEFCREKWSDFQLSLSCNSRLLEQSGVELLRDSYGGYLFYHPHEDFYSSNGFAPQNPFAPPFGLSPEDVKLNLLPLTAEMVRNGFSSTESASRLNHVSIMQNVWSNFDLSGEMFNRSSSFRSPFRRGNSRPGILRKDSSASLVTKGLKKKSRRMKIKFEDDSQEEEEEEEEDETSAAPQLKRCGSSSTHSPLSRAGSRAGKTGGDNRDMMEVKYIFSPFAEKRSDQQDLRDIVQSSSDFTIAFEEDEADDHIFHFDLHLDTETYESYQKHLFDVAEQPDNPLPLMKLMQFFIFQGLGKQAFSALSRAIEVLGSSGDLIFSSQHAAVCRILSKKLSARYFSHFGKTESFLAMANQFSESPFVLTHVALHLSKIRQTAMAEMLFVGALVLDPSYDEALLGYAHLLAEKGNIRTALRYLGRIDDRSMLHHQAKVESAWLQELKGVDEVAMVLAYKSCLSAGQHKSDRYMSLAQHAVARQLQRSEEKYRAAEMYKRSLMVDPDNAQASLLFATFSSVQLPVGAPSITLVEAPIHQPHSSLPAVVTKAQTSKLPSVTQKLGKTSPTLETGLFSKTAAQPRSSEPPKNSVSTLSVKLSVRETDAQYRRGILLMPHRKYRWIANLAYADFLVAIDQDVSRAEQYYLDAIRFAECAFSSVWASVALAHHHQYTLSSSPAKSARYLLQVLRRCHGGNLFIADLRSFDPYRFHANHSDPFDKKSMSDEDIVPEHDAPTSPMEPRHASSEERASSEMNNGFQAALVGARLEEQQSQKRKQNDELSALYVAIAHHLLEQSTTNSAAASAAQYAAAALKLNRSFVPALRCMGLALHRQSLVPANEGNKKRMQATSIQYLRTAAEASTGVHANPYALRSYALAKAREGLYQEAAKILEISMKLSPKCPKTVSTLAVFNYLGQVKMKGKSVSALDREVGLEALDLLARAWDLSQHQDPQVAKWKAQILMDMGRFQEAKFELKKALSLCPWDAVAFVNLAQCTGVMNKHHSNVIEAFPVPGYNPKSMDIASIENLIDSDDTNALFAASLDPGMHQKILDFYRAEDFSGQFHHNSVKAPSLGIVKSHSSVLNIFATEDSNPINSGVSTSGGKAGANPTEAIYIYYWHAMHELQRRSVVGRKRARIYFALALQSYDDMNTEERLFSSVGSLLPVIEYMMGAMAEKEGELDQAEIYYERAISKACESGEPVSFNWVLSLIKRSLKNAKEKLNNRKNALVRPSTGAKPKKKKGKKNLKSRTCHSAGAKFPPSKAINHTIQLTDNLSDMLHEHFEEKETDYFGDTYGEPILELAETQEEREVVILQEKSLMHQRVYESAILKGSSSIRLLKNTQCPQGMHVFLPHGWLEGLERSFGQCEDWACLLQCTRQHQQRNKRFKNTK